MPEHKDVAAAGGTIYDVLMSAPSFANVHEELLDTVLPHVEESEERRLLVVGPGPLATPYNKRPEQFRRLFAGRQHKVVMLDYNVHNLAECAANLHNLGILGEGMRLRVEVADADSFAKLLGTEVVMDGKPVKFGEHMIENVNYARDIARNHDANDLGNRITLIEHDLRRPLPELGQFDAVDASFTLHHVANYGFVLEARLRDIHDALAEGGMLHIATGFADMGYTEQKIHNLAQRVSKETGSNVSIIDLRDPEFPYTVSSVMGGQALAIVGRHTISGTHITIDSEGKVYVPFEAAEKCEFLFKGDYSMRKGVVIVPLIDAVNDYEALVKPVDAFYTPTNVEIGNLTPEGKVTQELIAQAVKEDDLERRYARRGLVEFYHGRTRWMKEFLPSAGFEMVEVKMPNDDGRGFNDLVNIVAYK
jgi:sulfur relay (sulfurtransferase) DsrF/TusC family protein